MTSWWRRRGLRARLTITATSALAIGLALASVLLVRGFASSRLGAIDATSRSVAANLGNLAHAGALPQALPVEAGQSAQVLDSQGSVVAVSPGTLRTLSLLPIERVRRLATASPSNQGIDTINGQVQSRVLVRLVTVGDAREYVVIAVALTDEQHTLHSLETLAAIAGPSLLVIVAATLWVLLGRALGAVTVLRRGAESVTDPASGSRLPLPPGEDEIHDLALTLNAMLDRLAAASQRERLFIADAAHELRSPVASMRTQLEVALSATTEAERRELTYGALEDTERLAALIQDLLALARLDSGAPIATAPVDLASLAGVPEQGPAVVEGDAPSLARAIDNLVINARRHARSEVKVSVTRVDGVVRVQVDDDGPGVAAADRQRIFERFVRLDSARTRLDGGAGLGLAIVQATAQAHRGSVSAGNSPLGGARFTLDIPA